VHSVALAALAGIFILSSRYGFPFAETALK